MNLDLFQELQSSYYSPLVPASPDTVCPRYANMPVQHTSYLQVEQPYTLHIHSIDPSNRNKALGYRKSHNIIHASLHMQSLVIKTITNKLNVQTKTQHLQYFFIKLLQYS
jgi:hypothetical protein